MIAALLIGLIGFASALVYLRSRQWVNAALALLAAAGLTLLLSDLRTPTERPKPPASAPSSEAGISLEFPRQLALGRSFTLTLKRDQPLENWRLQLVDENGGLLAQTSAEDKEASVSWLPPVAEAMVLQARVLDAAGKVLEQGPVPLEVQESRPLQIQGRFGAPSFDTQALNSLLVNSGAQLDWQLTLGKTVMRAETPRTAMTQPDLIVIDAAYFEGLSSAARGALLAQVGQGASLIVLAANARDTAVWGRELQLPLKAAEPSAVQARVELQSVPLQPALAARGPWVANQTDKPWLWQRAWQQGRIVWLGVTDWHRHAISAPQQLGSWWQSVLDHSGLKQGREAQWVFPDPMPLAEERTVVCMRGNAVGNAVLDLPEAHARLQLQRRADRADDACAALWPQQAGWLKLAPTDDKLAPGQMYVFAKDAWPQWQRGLKREVDAVRAHAAAPPVATALMAAWPWALMFAAGVLALWWRERRATNGGDQ